MRLRVAHVGLSLVLAVLAVAQEVTLAWQPKVGDVQTFNLRMEFTLFGDTAVYTAKVHEKVTEVAPDRITVETTQTEYKVTLFGEEGAVSDKDMPKASTVFSPTGDVLELKGDLVNDAAYRMANLSAVRRPDKAVKVGDTWVREVKGDTKTGALSAKATYKVEAEEKLTGVDALVCSYEYAETEGGELAQSVGKVWFAKATGLLLKSESTWSSAPVPGAPAPLNGTVTLERADAGL
jgi:hypothetical protein